MVFGTLDNPPAVDEVLTALEKPDVQAVVCLAAVPREERREFVERLLVPLRELRAATGRPHWILVDEAHDLMPASADGEDSPSDGRGEHDLRDPRPDGARAQRSSPRAMASRPAAHGAGAMIDAFAGAVSWGKPRAAGSPARARARRWCGSRKSERPVALIDIARVKAEPAAPPRRSTVKKAPKVGQVLRRA